MVTTWPPPLPLLVVGVGPAVGATVGSGAGVAVGLTEPVDPVQCQVDDYTSCSRGGAVALASVTMAGLGALVGNLIKTDVWTPVALDALGPARAREPRAGLGLRAVPGGVAAQMSVSF